MYLSENVGNKPFVATKEAIKLAGGVTATARFFDVTRSAIYQWVERGCPANRVLALSRLVDGRILPEEIRPDVFILD